MERGWIPAKTTGKGGLRGRLQIAPASTLCQTNRDPQKGPFKEVLKRTVVCKGPQLGSRFVWQSVRVFVKVC